MDPQALENRRTADRYMPGAGLSRVVVQSEGGSPTSTGTITEPKPPQVGHLYDISVSGVRFDLDDPLEEGESVAMAIMLPGLAEPIWTRGRIVRVYDEDGDAGPRRMAASLRSFDSPDDATRLARILGSGYFSREE
jgi:hypothetical protein